MTVMDAETGKLMNYKQLLKHSKYKGKWQTSSANEFVRLAQSVGGRIKGTNTITFICMEDVPKEHIKDKIREKLNTLCCRRQQNQLPR